VILCTAVLFVRKRHRRERGFEVRSLYVEGNQHLTPEEILALAGVTEGERLYRSQKLAMYERLLAHEWICDVRIKQGMGGVLIVGVKEYTPVAILRRSAPSLLCADGTVISYDSAFADLPTVYIHGKMDLSSITARIRMIRSVIGEERSLTIHFGRRESTYIELEGSKLRIGSNEPLPLEGGVHEVVSEMRKKGYRICDMRFKDQIIFEKGGAL
jgi:hypothetical protein